VVFGVWSFLCVGGGVFVVVGWGCGGVCITYKEKEETVHYWRVVGTKNTGERHVLC